MVTLGVAVPTIGRQSLDRTLDAITRQGLIEGDEVWVVYDARLGPQPELQGRVLSFGTNMRYLEHDAGESYQGLAQTNTAFRACSAASRDLSASGLGIYFLLVEFSGFVAPG